MVSRGLLSQAALPRAAPKSHLSPLPYSFAINLGQGTHKVALHFNPRFKESTIVCNSHDGNWGKEQRDSHLCFSPGSEIKVRPEGQQGEGGLGSALAHLQGTSSSLTPPLPCRSR